MQENSVFSHEWSHFLILKDYQKDLDYQKDWVFDVEFSCIVLLTVSFPNRSDAFS